MKGQAVLSVCWGQVGYTKQSRGKKQDHVTLTDSWEEKPPWVNTHNLDIQEHVSRKKVSVGTVKGKIFISLPLLAISNFSNLILQWL